jgi:hypothetical protein
MFNPQPIYSLVSASCHERKHGPSSPLSKGSQDGRFLEWHHAIRFAQAVQVQLESLLHRGSSRKSLAWVFRDIILDDEYGLSELAKKTATVLGVGGNIGLFTLWA